VHLRRALVPLVVVACTALSACGGGDSDSSSAGDEGTTAASSGSPSGDGSGDSEASGVSACDLLTTDEVRAAVGSPVKAGTPSSGPAITGGNFTSCVWQSADPDHPVDTATLTLYPNAAAADSAREDDSHDVDGIGDRAFSGSFASIWVYVGDRSFFAQWYALSGSDEESLPRSEALAQAAVDALG
jgi:hypothetical protein